MDFPACPVFEKNVEKAYRSVERAPRAAWRLATAIENLDDRWFSMLGALLGSASSSVFWYSYIEPLSSWGYAVFFVLVCALSAAVGAFIANVFKCLAWSFSEANTASPGTLENVLTKVAGDPRLEAVVQRWIEQRQARCVLQADVERLAKVTERLAELRRAEERRLEGLRAVDLQLNCVSRYHASVRQETLSAQLPSPDISHVGKTRL